MLAAAIFYSSLPPAYPAMLAQAFECCGMLQKWSPTDTMENSTAYRHSFNAARAPVGSEAALPEPVVTDLHAILTGVDSTRVTMKGDAVKGVGLQPEVHTFEERDKLLARFLKKSLTRLAILGSSDKPIRHTYTPFIQQATDLVAGFTQQLAHFEAMQRNSRAVLADMLLQSQAILNNVGESENDVSAGF